MSELHERALEAGRELDALIAEKVMGWYHWDGNDDYDGPFPMYTDWGDAGGLAIYREHGDVSDSFAPSTSIAAAWEVVEKLKELGWSFHLDNVGFHDEIEKEWRVCLLTKGHIVADGDTASHAICLAALNAIDD